MFSWLQMMTMTKIVVEIYRAYSSCFQVTFMMELISFLYIYHLRQHTWFQQYLIIPGFVVLNSWFISAYLPTSIKKNIWGNVDWIFSSPFVEQNIYTWQNDQLPQHHILILCTYTVAYLCFVCTECDKFCVKSKCLLGLHAAPSHSCTHLYHHLVV